MLSPLLTCATGGTTREEEFYNRHQERIDWPYGAGTFVIRLQLDSVNRDYDFMVVVPEDGKNYRSPKFYVERGTLTELEFLGFVSFDVMKNFQAYFTLNTTRFTLFSKIPGLLPKLVKIRQIPDENL